MLICWQWSFLLTWREDYKDKTKKHKRRSELRLGLGQIYGLTPGKHHVVSRKDGDLLLQDDQSISRKHAELFVSDDNTSDGIVLIDMQSKYGTFTAVRDGELTQLPANQRSVLTHKDHVRFGIQWNRWRVEFVPLLVATSTMTLEEKTEVKALVSVLGGQVVTEWNNNCTHLTMNKLTVTVKVVCALAAGQPIVTPAYWKVFSKAFNSIQKTHPDCKEFLPPLAEAVLDPSKLSFHPDPARAKLFCGITFVAVTAKQLSRIKPMVEAAGGSVVVFSPTLWPKKKLLEEKIVLMQSNQQSQVPDGYISLARSLKAGGVRCIPESEIGLSVLYCSLTRYCNPHFNPQTLLSTSSFLESTERANVVCPSSEELLHSESCSISAAGTSKKPMTLKRANEEVDSNENCCSKKPKEDFEDVFSSQNLHFQNTESSLTNLPLCSGKSLMLKQNISPKNTSMTKDNKKPIQHNPSLDMFAPSGEISSKAANLTEAKPSCEDMFGSGSSKFISNGKSAEKSHKFATTSNRSVNKSKIIFENNNDEFSFPSKKRASKPSLLNDDNDEFSFSSNKRFRVQNNPIDEDDVFSFAPKKRSRQSNPDMFASGDTPINGSVAGSSKLSNGRSIEEIDEIDFKGSKQIQIDDEFTFPEDRFPKKKRYKESLDFNSDSNPEVKIALFSKTTPDTHKPSTSENEVQPSIKIEDPEEEKNLVTYSKNMPMPTKVKKEIKDEKVDELAIELHNATIVLVKPLLVIKPKPVHTTDDSSTVINFKKFRKVIGVKKPIIPHIIGGCDLVAHFNEKVDIPDDVWHPSPQKQTPDDDWTFLGDKKKGNGRSR